MIIFAIYAVFVVACGFIAAGVGYLADASHPGIGDLVMVGVFTLLLWPAWTLALRITERFWPETEEPAA
jgi:hypothetical protein